MEFTFDTGADVSTRTEKASRKLGLTLKEPEQTLNGADGNRLHVLGVADAAIKSIYRTIDTSVNIPKGSRRNLLRMPEIEMLNLLAVINALCANKLDP